MIIKRTVRNGRIPIERRLCDHLAFLLSSHPYHCFPHFGVLESYREYSRKQEEGNRKMNRTNVKGTDNQIANVKNAGQEIHHESNSKAGCKDKHQTIKI